MNTKALLSLLCATALSLTTSAFAEGGKKHARPVRDHAHECAKTGAGTRDPGVNARQENQHDRVAQGVKSGQLTKEETKSLGDERKSIRDEEKAYKSDGTLTKDERKDLHQDLNTASKDIYKEKHDAETQPGVTPAQPGKPGTRDPGVNGRQENQHDRIKEGVKSGALTKDEAKALAEKEKSIRGEEKEYKSDGTLTKDERKDLHEDLSSTSKDIYSEKHDGETQTKTTTEK